MEAASVPAPAGTVERGRTREPIARRILRVLAKAPLNLFLVFIAVLWLVPTFGLALTSLMPADVISTEGWWKVVSKPSIATWDNYDALFKNNDLTKALLTTAEIAVGNTVLLVLVASLAGYAFAWIDFPGRDWLFVVVIGLLVVPLQVALIPIFSLYNKTGLFDTVIGLILFRLILPLGLPAIASLAIFQFLWTWNDLIVALTFARDTQPLTVAIFSQLRQFGTNIELIAPASFVSLAIPLAVFLAFQRYFVQGLLAGSVK